MFPNWNCTLTAIAASFHGAAILSTSFRLWYRWYATGLWWDDAWAALGLLADVACLVVTGLEQPIPYDSFPRFFSVGNWIFSFAYPTLMGAARVSILTSVVRVSRPEGILRRVALGSGILFGLIGVVELALRIQLCITLECLLSKSVLTVQIALDCFADALLSVLPVWFLRDLRLDRKRKILICSALSASMIINVVTVLEAVMLFRSDFTSGSIIFEHVRAACSMIVCNLLVIVTFVYRVLNKGNMGITEDSVRETNRIVFTTVDLANWGGWSLASKPSIRYPRGVGRSKISRSVDVTTSQGGLNTTEENQYS